MLRMSFVSLLLGLANCAYFALVANPYWVQRAPPPSVPKPDPHNFLPKRTRGQAPAKGLLQSGLLAALAASNTIPTLNLASAKVLKKELQKYCCASGYMAQTRKIQLPALSRLQTVLKSSSCHLLTPDDNFELIIDPGCSKPVSPCEADFIPGSLVDLDVPLSMDGISGQLIAHQKGRLCYKMLNDAGNVSVLECDGFLLPSLKI